MTRFASFLFATLGCLFAGTVLAAAGSTRVALAATPMPAPAGSASDLPGALWLAYRDHFVTPEGRVTDDVNGGISHSEGQGYGMLLAEAAGDDLTFARLWSWTSRELYRRRDGLASWRWNPAADTHITDPNNATDGDILIAWALARAAKRWNSPEYRIASRRIALAVGHSATLQTGFGLVILPGASGFGAADMKDGPVINLSYWVFPAFDSLAEVAPEIAWKDIAASGSALIAKSQFGPMRLPTEWISLHDAAPAPAADFKADFAYNAIRIPLYLAWGGAAPASLLPFAKAWAPLSDQRPSVVEVATGRPLEPFYEAGYGAVVKLTLCAAGYGPKAVVPTTVAFDHYYPSTLHLLSLVAAYQRGLACG